MAGVQLLLHDRHRKAAGVPLAPEHPEQTTHRNLPIKRTHRPQLPPNQNASRLFLLLGIELIQRVPRQFVIHTPPAQLLSQRALPQTPPPMPRLNPRVGKRSIIDQPDVGKPIQHLLGHLIRNLPLRQEIRQLSPSPRLPRQLVQQDPPSQHPRILHPIQLRIRRPLRPISPTSTPPAASKAPPPHRPPLPSLPAPRTRPRATTLVSRVSGARTHGLCIPISPSTRRIAGVGAPRRAGIRHSTSGVLPGAELIVSGAPGTRLASGGGGRCPTSDGTGVGRRSGNFVGRTVF